MKIHIDNISSLRRAINGDGYEISQAQAFLDEIVDELDKNKTYELDLCNLDNVRTTVAAEMQEEYDQMQTEIEKRVVVLKDILTKVEKVNENPEEYKAVDYSQYSCAPCYLGHPSEEITGE